MHSVGSGDTNPSETTVYAAKRRRFSGDIPQHWRRPDPRCRAMGAVVRRHARASVLRLPQRSGSLKGAIHGEETGNALRDAVG